jgi:glycosyltransferase involved in cell wall biosynthesis
MTAPKRNIVLVINDLKGNGAERVVITLANGFIEAGHQACIVCFKRHIELPVPESIPVHIFSEKKFRWIPRRLRGLLTAPWLDRFIRKHASTPDLVLSSLMPSDRILAYSSLPGVHFIIHSTTRREIAFNHELKQRKELVERNRIYRIKPSVCVSKGVEEDLRKLLDTCTTANITTIYNPVDVDKLKSDARETPNDIISDAILHVGKFNKAKRQDKLIRAYHAIDCPSPLVFIGQGPLMQEAKDLAKQLGIKERVHFMGFRKNPYPYIKAARLVVLCSDFEGLSLVLIEAISLGKTAISIDCESGPKEILPQENLSSLEEEELGLSMLLKKVYPEPELYKTRLKECFEVKVAVKRYLELAQNRK